MFRIGCWVCAAKEFPGTYVSYLMQESLVTTTPIQPVEIDRKTETAPVLIYSPAPLENCPPGIANFDTTSLKQGEKKCDDIDSPSSMSHKGADSGHRWSMSTNDRWFWPLLKTLTLSLMTTNRESSQTLPLITFTHLKERPYDKFEPDTVTIQLKESLTRNC